jgi:hypothetical protein
MLKFGEKLGRPAYRDLELCLDRGSSGDDGPVIHRDEVVNFRLDCVK